DSLRDSAPLYALISRHVNEELLERIATEYERGRWLLIATTDLDSRRPVLWNMGAMAASRSPKALELFRNILLASASIPGVFPPMMVDVEVDGKSYQEMHVDGGATAQVFLVPPSLAHYIRKRGFLVDRRKRTAYIIRNSRLDPDWASVDRRAMTILGRTVTSMIQTQGVGDLYRIYLTTQQNDVGFNLAFIGSDFKVIRREQFDTDYMNALYNYAHERAHRGYEWAKTLPSDGIDE
ncbi:MAG: patatin family protein, partial [Deltaproteobacteria bacterium]|nr:patatin family protein [Deltaproteobacteria bacterium]